MVMARRTLNFRPLQWPPNTVPCFNLLPCIIINFNLAHDRSRHIGRDVPYRMRYYPGSIHNPSMIDTMSSFRKQNWIITFSIESLVQCSCLIILLSVPYCSTGTYIHTQCTLKFPPRRWWEVTRLPLHFDGSAPALVIFRTVPTNNQMCGKSDPLGLHRRQTP